LLVIHVVVTVPERARVSALWLGISRGGTFGFSQKGHRPLLHPILAHPQGVLTAGRYSFKGKWRVPAKVQRRQSITLVAIWAARQPRNYLATDILAWLMVRHVPRS